MLYDLYGLRSLSHTISPNLCCENLTFLLIREPIESGLQLQLTRYYERLEEKRFVLQRSGFSNLLTYPNIFSISDC